MSTDQIHVFKEKGGSWHAQNDFELGDNRILRISTYKTMSGTLVSTANVHLIEGSAMVHCMGKDFNKRLFVERVRCTSKAVAEQHSKALDQLEMIKAEVAEHYKEKPNA